MKRSTAGPASLPLAEEAPDFTVRAPVRGQIRAQVPARDGVSPAMATSRSAVAHGEVTAQSSGQFNSETAHGSAPAARHFHEKRIDVK
jgi:hypothetical protein